MSSVTSRTKEKRNKRKHRDRSVPYCPKYDKAPGVKEVWLLGLGVSFGCALFLLLSNFFMV